MFKGASLTDIKQLFLTLKEMLITVARLDLHLVCSDSEGWLENMYSAVLAGFFIATDYVQIFPFCIFFAKQTEGCMS